MKLTGGVIVAGGAVVSFKRIVEKKIKWKRTEKKNVRKPEATNSYDFEGC